MGLLWWLVYAVAAIVGIVVLYLGVVLPIVLWHSAAFPKMCPACGKRELRYVKFVLSAPTAAASGSANPRAYYACRNCSYTSKLELGEWYPVDESEFKAMTTGSVDR